MTRQELKSKLERENLLEFVYYSDNDLKRFVNIKEPRDNVCSPHTFGVFERLDGKFEWFINDEERGLRATNGREIFNTEAEACDGLYEEICTIVRINKNRALRIIREHLKNTTNYSGKFIDEECAKFERNIDIAIECAHAIKEKKFYIGEWSSSGYTKKITVEGYTALELYENTNLSIIGSYNYLIYLREMPEKALADLKAGLSRK